MQIGQNSLDTISGQVELNFHMKKIDGIEN